MPDNAGARIKSNKEITVTVRSDVDVVIARQEGRRLAETLGFSISELTLIATAISEVARNIVLYAREGEITTSIIEKDGKRGVCIVARDNGPGIKDISLAMQDGYSTSGGLGLGLPGAKRIVDEFEIVSKAGKGTTVTMRKWKR